MQRTICRITLVHMIIVFQTGQHWQVVCLSRVHVEHMLPYCLLSSSTASTALWQVPMRCGRLVPAWPPVQL
jgi:hypothetical protein